MEQTFSDFEFLIFLDGVRRRELRDVTESFATIDARIRIVDHPSNQGLPFALNRLIAEARGDYLARMDADDICLPNRFERQVDFLNQHSEVSLLGSSAHEVDSEGNFVFHKTMPVELNSIKRLLCYRDPFIHPTVMFRKNFFDKYGLYSEANRDRFFEDTELWTRSLSNGCVAANLDEILLYFRVNPNLYGRRRGWHYINELRLRVAYALRSRQPIWLSMLAFFVFMMRLCPAPLVRWAYLNCRR